MLTIEPTAPSKENSDNHKSDNEHSFSEQLTSAMLTLFTLTINSPPELSDSHFAKKVSQHLVRLSQRLGITIKSTSSHKVKANGIALILSGQDCTATTILPMTNREGHYFSELTLQAATGIMSIHGRSRGSSEPLGVEYATVMLTVNALTGLFAQMYAAISALQSNPKESASKVITPSSDYLYSHCSPLATTLLGAGQYIADATAADPFPLPDDADNILCQPPFCSSDGVYFELESLDATPWRLFWERLGIAGNVSGKGWKNFQLRYAKAVSPLPLLMVNRLKQLSFDDIQQYCQTSGMHLVELSLLSQHSLRPHCHQYWQAGPWAFVSHKTNRKPVTALKANTTENSTSLPLANVTIVESCRRIQGPLATHILSLLGANVIRIEPPGGDPLRGMPPISEGCSVRFDAINTNKKITEINIKDYIGKQKIFDLVKKADIFIHNWAPNKAAQLNLGYADLSLVNPNLIYSYASGWDNSAMDENVGSNTLPGTDFMVQAVSGVALTIANNQKKKSAFGGSLFTVLDTLGGALAAQGMMISLLARSLDNKQESYKGYSVETSLLAAGNILCDSDLTDIYSSKTPSEDGYFDMVFETSTHSIAVSFPLKNQHSALSKVLGISIPPSFFSEMKPQDLDILIQVFKRRPVSEWLTALSTLKIPVALVNEDLTQLITNPSTQELLEKTHYDKVKSPWRFL